MPQSGATAAVLAMYAAFLLLGWLGAKRARASDLILGGRALPIWLAALTMTATWVDGGYLLGTAEGIFKHSPASGWQGGMCFGASLMLGGCFFASRMRTEGYTTLIDPFARRFGHRWAAVLALPAILGELFWSAELLVAVGAALAALLGVDFTAAVVVSAVVVILYTMAGGLWSVTYADVLQLLLVSIGMLVAIPFALTAVGGLDHAWTTYRGTFPDRGGLLPPFVAPGTQWTPAAVVGWWDVSLMLLLGGIPWNCYFQRVLACATPGHARTTSLLAGVMTMALVGPPLALGLAAAVYPWTDVMRAQLAATPAEALPRILGAATPPLVAMLGLGAIVGAVTSSFSASVLSAASMATWNGARALRARKPAPAALQRGVRTAIAVIGGLAVVLALRVQSVQALWYFTSDLVFVLLFPQLVAALYDRRVTRTASIMAFAVSLTLRLGGGEPLLGVAPFIPYPELAAAILPITPADWYDASGTMTFPFRAISAAAGLMLLPLLSRLAPVRAPRVGDQATPP